MHFVKEKIIKEIKITNRKEYDKIVTETIEIYKLYQQIKYTGIQEQDIFIKVAETQIEKELKKRLKAINKSIYCDCIYTFYKNNTNEPI